MTDVLDHAETDVRERILITAERLFREIESRFRAMTPFLAFLNAPLAKPKKRIEPVIY